MTEAAIRHTLARQYHASLAMLESAIEQCPDELWFAPEYKNRYWHIAYHALFYAHLYLAPSEADFRPWARHQHGARYLGPGPWASPEELASAKPYTQAELLEYLALCQAEVDLRMPSLELDAESGFDWLSFNKLEVQFYNIRHIQHHCGQLADRLRAVAGLGVPWIRPD